MSSDPVKENVPVAGLKSSTEVVDTLPLSSPPTMSTLPSGSRVALAAKRAVPMGPVGEKVAVSGS